jgi:hypothetical protein
MNTTHPPVGPTEKDVRAHFGAKLNPASPLMRPAYTSIWALEDGTLLWDWKEGYAVLGPKLKCIIYLTGPQGSGKSTLVGLMRDAVEVETPRDIYDFDAVVEANSERACIVFTAAEYSRATFYHLQEINKGLKLIWLTAN